MVPDSEAADGAAISRQAREFWRHDWQGQTLMAVGVQDPVLGPPVMKRLQGIIRACPEALRIEQGGHFVQEHGQAIAQAALQHFKSR
jgi:tRNA(adenine34) deaminase